jgi:ankyrin repeat protein
MYQPDDLKSDQPLLWSPGTGVEVWGMIAAAIAGDLRSVERLVARNPALVRCHYQYRKPLVFAVRENRLEVAAFLLERDPDLTGLAPGDTPLEIARDRGYQEMESLLVRSSRNASPKGEAVAAAIRARDLPAVRRLLDDDPSLLHTGDTRSNQPIHWAVMTRQPELIDELLHRGADLEAERHDRARPIQLTNGDYHFRGWRHDFPVTPAEVLAHLRSRGAYYDICTAAHAGDLGRVRELLDQDPSLANHVTPYLTYSLGAGTPLRNAAGTGQLEIVELLLERRADPNVPEEGIAPRGHALYSAVAGGHLEIAKLLLEHGADPSPPVESSADALSIAISRGDGAMIELLCSYGSARSVHLLAYYGDLQAAAAVFAANPALADDPEAFANAAENDHLGFLRLMLRYHPRLIERVSCRGKTTAVTEQLLDLGMNPSRADWLGITQLHHLAREGNLEQAALFIDRGADLEARDDENRSTPLGWAAKAGQLAMVTLLLERGAKTDPAVPPWATPVAWATRRGHLEVADLLQGWETHPNPAAG